MVSPGDPFLPKNAMQYFTDTYEATGFTGGLNWYRAMGRMGSAMAGATSRIEAPSLYIGFEHDVVLPPSSADGMEDFITNVEKYTVLDSGHWTQQEKPEEVNGVIVEWLNRKIASPLLVLDSGPNGPRQSIAQLKMQEELQMNILVLGATGNTGSAIVKQLQSSDCAWKLREKINV